MHSCRSRNSFACLDALKMNHKVQLPSGNEHPHLTKPPYLPRNLCNCMSRPNACHPRSQSYLTWGHRVVELGRYAGILRVD